MNAAQREYLTARARLRQTEAAYWAAVAASCIAAGRLDEARLRQSEARHAAAGAMADVELLAREGGRCSCS